MKRYNTHNSNKIKDILLIVFIIVLSIFIYDSLTNTSHTTDTKDLANSLNNSVTNTISEDTQKPQTEISILNGSIFSQVVDKDDENKKISNAQITITSNSDSSITEVTKTDEEGHFEFTLPTGKYILKVTANGYNEYISGEIEVKNESMNYDALIKLEKTDNSPEIVKAVINNENIFVDNVSELNLIATSLNNSLSENNMMWFQDINMDGQREFITQSESGGDLTLQTYFTAYKCEDGNLVPYCNIHNNSYTCIGKQDFDYKLYRKKSDNKFVYLKDSYVFPVVSGSVERLALQGMNSVEVADMCYGLDPDVPGYINTKEWVEDFFSNGEYVDDNAFLEFYNTYVGNLVSYSTSVSKINIQEYLQMSEKDKKSVLTQSYDSWSYSENTEQVSFMTENVISPLLENNNASNNITDYKSIYKSKLLELGINQDRNFTVSYCLYDMDSDNIPELIVKTGTCEANFTTSIYTVSNNDAILIGQNLMGFHTGFNFDETTNQVALISGQMDFGEIHWLKKSGESIETTNVQTFSYERMDFNTALLPYGNFKLIDTETCCYSLSTDNIWDSYWGNNKIQSPNVDFSLIDNY